MASHVKKALEANISDPQSALSAAFVSADQAFLDSGDYEEHEKVERSLWHLTLYHEHEKVERSLWHLTHTSL